MFFAIFFFQAEDGIRDDLVTGVQTCALPILPSDFPLMGVQQGCKTVMIYSPVPLAGYWEANLFKDGGKGQKAFRKIGRASCRERVEMSVVAVAVKKIEMRGRVTKGRAETR